MFEASLASKKYLQSCLALFLTLLLTFPPSLTASYIDTNISWNGGTDDFTDSTNWTCPDCGGQSTYPWFGNLGRTWEVTVASGGTDVVNMGYPGLLQAQLESLTLGTAATGTAALNTNGTYLYLDRTTGSGNILTVGNGGTLNVNGGAQAFLYLGSGGAQVNAGGQIDINNSVLYLGSSGTLTNNGTINLQPYGSLGFTNLSLTLSGSGSLVGASSLTTRIGTSAADQLINDTGHTISGSTGIYATVTNKGTITASSGYISFRLQ